LLQNNQVGWEGTEVGAVDETSNCVDNR
jgi:hypothetical protein